MRIPILLLASCLLTLSSCSRAADIGCDSDDDCRNGRVCLSSKCVTPNNGFDNNSDPNNENVDPSNTPNNIDPSNTPNNIDPSNTPNNVDPNNVNREDLALCVDLCDKLLGSCVDQACDIPDDLRVALDDLIDVCIYEGFEDGDLGCLDALSADPYVRAEVEQLVDRLECDSPELEQFRCEELELGPACGCDPIRFNDVGDSCSGNTQCDGGAFDGVCLDESNEPPFPDGYCVSIGCAIDPDNPVRFDEECGMGNVCWAAGQGGMTGVCVDGCDAHSECRDGYQCRLAGAVPGEFRPIRFCLPECGPNLLCRNQNERCNQGRCEFECTEATPTGEPSGREICETLGFECQPDDAGTFWCVMP